MATMAGLLTGYIAYDMTHYYTHHGKPRSRVGKYLKRYHLAHHHKEPDRLFGVSNPLWDVVFRTGMPKSGVPKSGAGKPATRAP
jgi:sterol desaturase/sphingolipid hydroxylase (fatty acid hydroxylase superfamily)